MGVVAGFLLVIFDKEMGGGSVGVVGVDGVSVPPGLFGLPLDSLGEGAVLLPLLLELSENVLGVPVGVMRSLVHERSVGLEITNSSSSGGRRW